jgi:hypothetical protein
MNNPKITDTVADLPLKSQYKLFMWYGQANGANLTPAFQPVDIQSRIVVIKAIKIVPYYNAEAADFFVSDGVDFWTETIPLLTRMDRVFDLYSTSAQIRIIINGAAVPVFTYDNTLVGLPLDLDLDNIFYKFPEKIQSWDVSVAAEVYDLANPPVAVTPLVKVLIECYLL